MFIKLLKCLSGENEQNERANILRTIYMEQVLKERDEELSALKLINKDLKEKVAKLESQVIKLTNEMISQRAEIATKKTKTKKEEKEAVDKTERITDEELERLSDILGVKVRRREDFKL
jgi:Skp family chaperone for outer membrane proteins